MNLRLLFLFLITAVTGNADSVSTGTGFFINQTDIVTCAHCETGEPIQIKGYWSAIDTREGNDWKIRMLTWNITPGPPAEK
jgi:hypothetical protein